MAGTTRSLRRLAAAVVAGALSGTLTACHGGDTGASHKSGASGGPAAEHSAAVLSEDQVKDALPDPRAMDNLQVVSAGVNPADGHLGCPSVQECKGKWFGHAKYALSGATHYINFEITTYANEQDAKAGMNNEAGDNPALSKPTFGNESRAYTKSGGGLQGEYVTMRVGTVVATAFVEGGATEPMLTQGTTMFAQRIAQAEAGQKATATLPQE